MPANDLGSTLTPSMTKLYKFRAIQVISATCVDQKKYKIILSRFGRDEGVKSLALFEILEPVRALSNLSTLDSP